MNPRGPKDRFTVVPWMASEQFQRVYNQLFGGSLFDKRLAVDQIGVWNTRCFPSLPTAVESTVGLFRAVIHDMLYQANKSFCQEADVQMMYAIGIIRFVNLTLEHHQKAVGKIRMSVLAAKQNIPSWLIDLRNEAAHEFCPSLPMLRSGADKAIQYLEETFWSKEATNVNQKSNHPSLREADIVDLLNQYKNLQFQRIENETLTRCQNKDLKAVLKKLAILIRREKDKFLDVFVQPGNFIDDEDVKRLITKTGPFLAQDVNLCLPNKMQKFWFPILRKIHQNDLIPSFLEKLLIAQQKCNNKICQKTAIAWAQQILIAATSKSNFILAKCFGNKGLVLDLRRLLYCSMKGATPYSLALLITIVTRLGNKEQYNNLFGILALYQGRCLDDKLPPSKQKKDPYEEIVFTVEDVEEEFNERRAKKLRTDKKTSSWYIPSVTLDFSDISVGTVLNSVDQDTSRDKQTAEDSQKLQIKLEPSLDDDFILVNKNDGEGTVKEEITHDINRFPATTRPENFDMVYRRKQ